MPIVSEYDIANRIDPPSAQSPFAYSGCYPVYRVLKNHISERYFAFIATTDSSVNPKPSQYLDV